MAGRALPICLSFQLAVSADSKGHVEPQTLASFSFENGVESACAGVLADFAAWGANYLRAKGIGNPVFYPLPHDLTGLHNTRDQPATYLSKALLDRIGPRACLRLDLISQADAGRNDCVSAGASLAPSNMRSSTVPARGTPILVGHVYDPDLGASEILRSCALRLNEIGVKGFHALYLARAVRQSPYDPFSVADETFNVRSAGK